MNPASSHALKPAFSPLNLQSRSLVWQLFAIALGTVVLAVSSRIQVPMIPVPVTMQTFAVTMIGALYGWRLGGITILAWLFEAAAGLPVLSGGPTGIQYFFGPTGGYLVSFPLIGMLTGYLAEAGWNGKRPFLAFLGMLIANLLCLVIGAAWLSTIVGVEKAIVAGVIPFIVGAVLKSALGAAVLRLFTRGSSAAPGNQS